MDIVQELKLFEIDHEPDGWPAIRMRQISAVCDEITALRAENERLKAELASDKEQWVGLWKMRCLDRDVTIEMQRGLLLELREELAKCREDAELEPVHGDLLPPVGSEVLIHLGRQDAWVKHKVVGYYAWGDLSGNPSLHRVFVRVVDSEGYPNARLLKDVRPTDAARKGEA